MKRDAKMVEVWSKVPKTTQRVDDSRSAGTPMQESEGSSEDSDIEGL